MSMTWGYADNERSRYLQDCIANSERVLSLPDTIYSNGRHSHEAAGETIERCEQELIEHIAVAVTPA